MLMLRLHRRILFFQFLQLCNAVSIPCTVTQDAGGTHYSVAEFHATKCHFYWTNSSNFVLANHEDHKVNNLVLMSSIRSLRTSECLKVFYKRDCISEGTPREANCSINCSEPHGTELWTTRVPLSFETKPGPLTAVVARTRWALLAAVTLVVVVVMVVVLCCKYNAG